jgi:protein-tyrosine kinase
MSSLIEQAAKRLEQLRAAGVVIPEIEADLLESAGAARQAAAPMAPAVPAAPNVPAPAARVAAPLVTSKTINLDLEALAVKGIVTPNAPRSFMADQYRVIKRPLIANAVGKGASKLEHGNLIMVTSALPARARASRRSTWR